MCYFMGFPGGSVGKEPGFDLWVGKIPCRRERQLIPIVFQGEFHGQRSLAAIVHGVAKSWAQLSDLTHTCAISGLLNLSTIDVLNQMLLCCGEAIVVVVI